MYINTDYNNSISFNARLGANLKQKLLVNEFGGDTKRFEKFERLFRDTFDKKIDTNTVVDISESGRFKISNPIGPKITYSLNILNRKKPLPQRILTECDRVYANAEYRLFQKIISKGVRSGKSLEQMSKLSEKLDDEIRPYYTDLIGTATRILKENPNSKLTELEFMDMINTQMREIIETPEFQQAMSNNNFSAAAKILLG